MPSYRGSWYSQFPDFGWTDPADKPNSNALGVPDAQQGIALPSRRTLGQYFNVTAPNGQTLRLQQTDIGPAKWTGRGVDISAAAGHQFGYNPKTFPTDASFAVESTDGGTLPDNPVGPQQQDKSKMPSSLMDFLNPDTYQARDQTTGQPISFGDAIGRNSNSLIGAGLGLLQMQPLGGSGWANALQGYQKGAVLDQRAQALREEDAQRKQAQANWEKQFARSDPTKQPSEWSKIAREIMPGVSPNSPEYLQGAKQFYSSKTEGDWTVQEDPDTGSKYAFNKRTLETKPIPVPGAATAAAPADRAFPPPSPGMDRKEYQKEMTKLTVQQRAAEEARKKQASMIDPVSEDINRAINAVQNNPGLTTGALGGLMSNVPGTKAGDVAGLVNTIKANSSFDKMQQMRAASPTGSTGLGAVTQAEHKLLQDAIGELQQSRSSTQFLANLDRVRRMRLEMIHGPGAGGPAQFQPPEEQRAPSARQIGGGGVVRWGRDASGNPVPLP